MYATDNTASSAFHATVSAAPRVPTPDPVYRVALRLTLYPGRVHAFTYVLTSIPRPGRLYSSTSPPPLPPSLPPLPPASEQSETEQQLSQPR
eukprot:1481270-Pleurochrysis_carterae.AAC.1